MKPHTPISAISAQDRPRERLLALGPRRLRNEELLAIVIGSGTRSASSLDLARTILKRTSGPAGLTQASLAALLETEGVGPAVAMRIVAGCELHRRAMRARPSSPLARAPAAGGPGSDSLRQRIRDLSPEPPKIEQLRVCPTAPEILCRKFPS